MKTIHKPARRLKASLPLPVAADKRRGAVSVEFAIVAPLIFLLFLGALELTAMNFLRQTAGNASYEGCRQAILPGGSEAAAKAEALRLMETVGIGAGVVVSVSQDSSQATVEVAVPAARHSWGLVRFTGGFTIRQSCTLTKEALR